MTEATRDSVLTPLFRRHVRRPRLTDLLDEARAQSILLTAPAGYGKTTLAREWLQGRGDVAWYHATAGSADVGAFSAGLADAVGPVVPGAGERVRQRLRVGDATERLARPLAELLAEDLEAWPAGGMIVLDDYHLMAESSPVEDFLDWLLTLAPIRLLVTTRRRPGWATARRFLYGEAVEIGRNELAMTDEEAGRLLEGRSSDSVRALVRQADGWPALIGLAALSSDLEFPAEKVSESLFRYFAEEVLRREPRDVQRFMLLASIGSRVSVRIGREVLGFPDPEPVLERLRDEGLMQDRARSDAHRFHPLLREFLRVRLQTREPEAFAERARALIEHARKEHDWEEAFGLCVDTDETVEAAGIAGLAARTLLAAGQSETLEKWLAACGAASVTVPGAALARAEILIRQGEMSAASALAQDTARRLPEDHVDYAWACNVAGRALHFMSREKEALRKFDSGRMHARTTEDKKDALWGSILVMLELAPTRASSLLDELESLYSDDIDTRFRLAVGRAVAAEQQGSIVDAWDEFRTLLPSIRYSRDPLASSSLLASAAINAVMRGEYTDGRRLADQAFAYCSELRIDFALGTCLAYRAAAEIGLRQFHRADRTLALFGKSAIRREDPFFQLEELRIRTRLLSSRGALDKAVATEDDLPAGPLPSRPLGAYLATLALVYAALGYSRRARRLATRARTHGNHVETHYCALLADAVSKATEGPDKRTAHCLRDAIRACGRAHYLDGLVAAYRAFPQLLKSAHDDRECMHVLRLALTLSFDHALAKAAKIAIRPDHLKDPLNALTPREREVLELLSEGLTNGEIARRLYITPATVKVHVRRIMAKIGARNRVEAAIRARDMLASEAN